MGLRKIAIDLARRAFMFGAAGKALEVAPAVAMAAKGSVSTSLGLALQGKNLNSSAYKAINRVGDSGMNIAKLRHYRMKKVNGASTPTALGSTYAAAKATQMLKPAAMLNQAEHLDSINSISRGGLSQFKPEAGLSTVGSVKSSYGKVKDAAKELYGGGMRMFQQYYK